MIYPHEMIEQREKAKEEKIKFVNNYINIGNEILKTNNSDNIRNYCKECLGVFADDVNGFSIGLNMDYQHGYTEEHIKTIIKKLEKYIIDLKMGNYDQNNSNTQNISVTASASNETNIEITVSSTISNIMQLPEEKLSLDEKMELARMLTDIEKNKKDKNIWSKVKDAIKWIVGKGAEVALSTIPYLMGILK